MPVVIDTSMLLLFLRPDTPTPRDRDGRPLPPHPRARIAHLIKELEVSRTTVVVPTPVLAEILVRTPEEDAKTILERLNQAAAFEMAPFDQRAAIELADLMRIELDQQGRRKLRQEAETWAKLKFDRQIVAIAKVRGAATIYSHDAGIRTVARRIGIDVLRLQDLPLPPEVAQLPLPHTLDG